MARPYLILSDVLRPVEFFTSGKDMLLVGEETDEMVVVDGDTEIRVVSEASAVGMKVGAL